VVERDEERDEERDGDGRRGGEEWCGLEEEGDCDSGCLVVGGGWEGSCDGKEGEECG
jgi:hypothetical protein